ncbi:MAG: helix-turn-helix domain-containing protein [Candidatus Latescibacteria bacterium]|nr:helix-turn-helix domain-containing protein [Candidatus Latescibacterota bacterium]NIO28445.1 helix-turn-helix domain-containing protein [Candidatus Latescibacterota bacterium]NIO55994.1 helix-turn-helix domain-containing protein [Candidatus Latescibacterota bacterium]NIT01958.1 helix-turn-helix domain-containing protein [Candidatus Latescibacterota bacterium]
METIDPQSLDKTIHSPVRLAIMAALVASEEIEFRLLKDSFSLTDGNLSSHLLKLEESGYIKVKKTFKGKRPLTILSATKRGRRAFEDYVDKIERIIGRASSS